MQFRLSYRGPLRSAQNRGRLEEVHHIRRIFHPQMKRLWTLPPLKSWEDWSLEEGDPKRRHNVTIRERRGPFIFCPLICSKLQLAAQLRILMLRGVAPGRLFDGGDIDNRIKILLDALRMPKNDEIRSAFLQPSANDGELPFFTVLEDDSLITGLSVDTDYLLDPSDKNEVLLVIDVTLKPTTPMAFHEGLV